MYHKSSVRIVLSEPFSKVSYILLRLCRLRNQFCVIKQRPYRVNWVLWSPLELGLCCLQTRLHMRTSYCRPPYIFLFCCHSTQEAVLMVTPWWITLLRRTSLCCSQISEYWHLLQWVMNWLNCIYDQSCIPQKHLPLAKMDRMSVVEASV